MNDRSATASIKGYNYQFLHSIINLFEQKEDSPIVIEGIEDFDVENKNYIELIQYKYHEFAKYTNSQVAKPIGLMFNHFLKHEDMDYKYKLMIYITTELPEFTLGRVKEILELKGAQKYIDEEYRIYSTDLNKIRKFKEKFSCLNTKEYNDIEDEAVSTIEKNLQVSNIEASFSLLPLALKKIVSLGIQREIENRTITLRDFKLFLQINKNCIDLAYTKRIKGEERARQKLLKHKRDTQVKPNNADHIVYIDSEPSYELSNIILDIAKMFFYKGMKNDYRPITFIAKNAREIKYTLFKTMNERNESIIMNDGFEEFSFNLELFNKKVITTNKPLNSKVNEVNYNFKLISLETYRQYSTDIRMSNPVLFCNSSEIPDSLKHFSKVYMTNFLN